jgi:four helix bundle protein
MRDFRKLEVWHQSMELVDQVYDICHRFPKSEIYGIVQQIQRYAVSIPSNIAEGCSRDSVKEYSRFIQIALGSAFELETQLLISQKRNFIQEDVALFELLLIIQKRLNALNTSIS